MQDDTDHVDIMHATQLEEIKSVITRGTKAVPPLIIHINTQTTFVLKRNIMIHNGELLQKYPKVWTDRRTYIHE